MSTSRYESIVLARLREHLESSDAAVGVELGPDTPLLGRQGVVDSLGLVSVVVAVEQTLADELGVTVSLADDRAFSQKSSPFRTVRTLAAYAAELAGT